MTIHSLFSNFENKLHNALPKWLSTLFFAASIMLGFLSPVAQAAPNNVYPKEAQMQVGQQLCLLLSSQDSASLQAGQLTTKSSNPKIASIHPNGIIVKALAVGQTRIQLLNRDGSVMTSASITVVSANKTTTLDAKGDAEKCSRNAPLPTIGSKKTIASIKASTNSAFAKFVSFYNGDGSTNYNPKTNRRTDTLTKSDDPTGLYYASILALAESDYRSRHNSAPSIIGTPNSLPSLNDADYATIRTWLRSYYPKASVGDMAEMIWNYPGSDNDTPLDTCAAMDALIEEVYRLDSNYYVVSAIAYYGELRRFGYDIGLERKSNGNWIVHFIAPMWSA